MVNDPMVNDGPGARPGLSARLRLRRGSLRLDLGLEARPGEVVAVVGPNGAGKSTVLRAVAGLLPMEHGRVALDGVILEDTASGVRLPSHRRGIGVVFQDYLLFPHLSVLDNVAFGPRMRGLSRPAARKAAMRVLQRLEAADLALLRPRTLSGGQAQRVALARAIVSDPRLLLLDEPLAALDARTRLLVRGELRRQLDGFEGAALVVTHDALDAAVLADRIVVVEAGRVVQDGTPADVARRPRTEYVARLVGLNLLSGTVSRHAVLLDGGGEAYVSDRAEGQVHVAFRPASVSLFTSRPDGSPRNLWQGRVAGLEQHGDGVRVEVRGAPSPDRAIVAEVTAAAVADLRLVPGTPVWAGVKASDVEVYPR